jgi:hypothetical protein
LHFANVHSANWQFDTNSPSKKTKAKDVTSAINNLLIALAAVIAAGYLPAVSIAYQDVAATTETNEWESKLQKAFRDAEIDQLIIRIPSQKKDPLLDIKVSAEEVASLVSAIRIDAEQSGFHCMCDGDYHFLFMKAGKEVASIGYHHSRSLRWHGGGWKGDGLLTEKSRNAVIKWFDDHTFDQLRKDYEKAVEESRREQKEEEEFASFFPEAALEAMSLEEAIGAFASRTELGIACCKAMSVTSLKSWTISGGKERFALALGNELSGPEFQAVLDHFDASGEPQWLPGAARFFFREGFLAKTADDQRDEWIVKLAKIELNAEYDENKSQVMRQLAANPSSSISELLWEIANEQTGQALSEDAYGDEPNLVSSALLALAEAGDSKVKTELEKRLANADDIDPSDRAAMEIGLVMLGDPSFIRAEHFELASYTIGNAAIRAIERFDGKHGLQVLENAGTHHPWAFVSREAEKALDRLKKAQK